MILKEFLRENPNASEKEIEIESSRLQRGGVVLVVLSTPVEHPKIPKWEMQLSVDQKNQSLTNFMLIFLI